MAPAISLDQRMTVNCKNQSVILSMFQFSQNVLDGIEVLLHQTVRTILWTWLCSHGALPHLNKGGLSTKCCHKFLPQLRIHLIGSEGPNKPNEKALHTKRTRKYMH